MNSIKLFHIVLMSSRIMLTAVAAVVLVMVAGCDKPAGAQPHDHDHDHAGEAHDEGEHDHGDDHADDEHAGDEHDHASGEHVDEVTLATEAVEGYGVKTQMAQRRVLRPTFVVPARVELNAEAMAHVGSRLSGWVAEINARLGDVVHRGDPLLVVESLELGEAQADYLQRRSAVQAAVPMVELTKDAWMRAKNLLDDSQGISLSEVQRREAEYTTAIAAQTAAESAVLSAERRLRLLGLSREAIIALVKDGEISPQYTVRAPIDGQIIEREITLGELVGPDRSTDALMVLADTSTLWVVADVPESRLNDVGIGSHAWIIMGYSDTHRIEGRVTYVDSLVESATRTVEVRIEVGTAESLAEGRVLKPGMFARVELAAGDGEARGSSPVVVVPRDAVQTVEGATAVFVPVNGKPNTFGVRSVAVGAAVGGFVPIYDGLEEGEAFVAQGSFILKAELGKGSAAHEH